MREIADLDPETAKIAKIVLGTANANGEMITELEKSGVNIDLAKAMVENYFVYMVDLGLLTEEQYWGMKLAWEESLRSQLMELDRRVRAAKAQMKQEAKDSLSSILRPPDKKLIVPGQD